MHTQTRRSRSAFLLALALTLGSAVAACGPDTSIPSARPSATPSVVPSAAATGESSVAPSAPASIAAGSQTDTTWGRIWDAVPPGFPAFPGSSIADPVSPEPVSATFAMVGGDPAEIAAWMQGAVETAGFATESLSGPQEGGGFVLESIGEGDCRIQTTVAPMGSLAVITILYGSACPAA